MRVGRRGLRWLALALPLVVAGSAAAGVGEPAAPQAGSGPVIRAVDPVDAAGHPVAVDGSLPAATSMGEALSTAGPVVLTQTAGSAASPPSGPLGIPGVALAAYRAAADGLARSRPGCHLSWSLLASIGRIESGHARGGDVDAGGTTRVPILGPVLDGAGFAAIPDTDGGAYDGDARWDRAVGPMQFIPSTWRVYGLDGNGDGRADPGNLYDASLAAGAYLCAGGVDTADPRQRASAVFRYNHSDSYVATVLLWADAYAAGVRPLPGVTAPAVQVALSAPTAPTATPGPAPLPVTTAPSTPAQARSAAPATTSLPTTSSAPANPSTSAPPSAPSSTTPSPSSAPACTESTTTTETPVSATAVSCPSPVPAASTSSSPAVTTTS
ncbi:lytic murein transglycosylase [Amycolatopsis cynarae]|uniref:Lytic murein transglycosylase n=1 Tax=Amycolatopsis cynarae TaxID=2995223 RepID=A0ABY7B7N7_9PSEU|nr:lytic murein transglycosylase [Amycolatopsis sp. HUAS 11-8]WAL68350.1 lytic murein transglycosylase [Amycolatopsis sp. HUAS 11-8]